MFSVLDDGARPFSARLMVVTAAKLSSTMSATQGNRGSDWELYAAHRERFTQAVLSCAASPGGRLCVLGAGKCNDLDLGALAGIFDEIHLVDLDRAALASAVSREPPDVRARLVPHAGVDLGLLTNKRVEKWRRKAPSPSDLDALGASVLADLLVKLPGPFDVVVSACLITQLGFALTQTFGDPHPLLGPLRIATARAHLQTLLELAGERGTALFISDLASSTNYPLDDLPADADLQQVMDEVLEKRAFYHLARPDLIEGLLAELAPEREPQPLTPWLWHGPQERTYLVYGYEIVSDWA